MTSATRDVAAGCLAVIVVAALGGLMGLQGWRSRVPNPDNIPSISGAFALVESGHLPDRGVLNSYLSYVPPGATWLFVPGARFSPDPRLTEFPGSLMLSAGTLIGIFVLARRHVGLRAAALAVALYGLSEMGVKYFGTVGPRGHPFFFVWMVYFACEWVARSNAWFLGAALGMWVTGMYVFLELAPAFFMLPAVWIMFRPPIRIRPVALVAVLSLLMWYPYLRFEAGRGFADLKSQVLLQTLPAADGSELLCNPSLRFREVTSGAATPAMSERLQEGTTVPGGVAMRIGRRVLALGTGSLATLGTVIPGADVVLLVLTLCGIFALSSFRRNGGGPGWHYGWIVALATALVVLAIGISPPVVRLALGRSLRISPSAAASIRTVQILLVLAAVTVVAWRPVRRGLARLHDAMEPTGTDPRVLVVSLVVTWAVCLAVVEYGRGERMSFLWPVQAVVLAGAVTAVSKVTRASAVGCVVVLAVVMAGPVMTAVTAVRSSGWSGSDAEEITIARDLAGDVRAARRSQAAIGYQVYLVHTWGEPFVQADLRYKVGADFDLLLLHPHGIVNTNRCAEGIARDDEFRVVATQPPNEALEYVDVPGDASYVPTRTYPSFELRRRR